MIGSPRARVVHAIPGRLRLRWDRREADGEAWAPLLARLRGQPGVRAARFNPASGSLVVEYDPAAITDTALMRELPAAALPLPREGASAAAGSTPAARALTSNWW